MRGIMMTMKSLWNTFSWRVKLKAILEQMYCKYYCLITANHCISPMPQFVIFTSKYLARALFLWLEWKMATRLIAIPRSYCPHTLLVTK